MKLLIVEDEAGLSKSITQYLKNEDFVCEVASDLETASDKVGFYDYECIILDITLPDGNGLSLLRDLKSRKRKDGVIIISAKSSIDDKIEGLKIGADDYLTKPFHLSELSARIHAIIRRKYFDGSDEIWLDNLSIDLQAKKVHCEGEHLDLTKTEFDLLVFLISNKNKVVSKKAIAENLSGDNADYLDSYDFIYSHLKNLKRKLHPTGFRDAIKSVYGLGYKFKS